ncbi:MAG: malto-oligosyltrehalose trehalohydrolase [Deltaproteobacteria bacterium]|nr:malto-oligosyltrehalose trehalohydrolase [Deltaproteobacteria bacterium]
MTAENRLGASCLGKGMCRFLVYAPAAEKVEVHFLSPRERMESLSKDGRGYHHGVVKNVAPGALYRYRMDGQRARPDPASRFQPQGVHGPSQVVDPGTFPSANRLWPGIPLEAYILYELHVGTFTPEGTFEAVIPRLDALKDLGITAIELMPVAQFPGSRNWGYDGTYPFAAQNSYGGPKGLAGLVEACHLRGLAVVLDVVCNHIGPEGNYLGDFGPYFTGRYRTPWGQAVNFDGPHSDEVRRFFLESALAWISDFRVDALRIDAIHGIMDFSASPFLAELSDAVRELASREKRKVFLIPESDLNDVRAVSPKETGGYGMDAQWNDDFHHALHALLTGERNGYYRDFGALADLAKAHADGFVYAGRYSEYRKRRHGNSSRRVPASRFVVFSQNHDQTGNRPGGERLSRLVSFEALKLAAGLVLFSPFLPLLFMGEEYGEEAPFPYFISHSDEPLIEAVRTGRKEELKAFGWEGEPPDPQDESTFLIAKPNPSLQRRKRNRILREFYRELIRIRKGHPALSHLSKEEMDVSLLGKNEVLLVRRWNGAAQAAAAYHFGDSPVSLALSLPTGRWEKLLDSSDGRWGGDGGLAPAGRAVRNKVAVSLKPKSFVLLSKA